MVSLHQKEIDMRGFGGGRGIQNLAETGISTMGNIAITGMVLNFAGSIFNNNKNKNKNKRD